MKKNNTKIKPSTVYFLGSPDQLHFVSSMMKTEDAFLLVENPDTAEHILATACMSELLEAHQKKPILIDFSRGQEEPESVLKSVLDKIRPEFLSNEETSDS